MRIVLISNLYPPEIIGGAEKHVAGDAKNLVDKGHDVSVITTSQEGRTNKFIYENVDEIDIYRFKPLNMYSPYEHPESATWKKPIQHTVDLWNPQIYWMLKSQLQDLNPDILHIHNYGGLSKSVFSVAGQMDAPVVHTLHDYGALHIKPDLFIDGEIVEPGLLMKLYQKYNDWIIDRNVDKILAPSEFVINKHESAGMFADTPTERLPLGIESVDTSKTHDIESKNNGCRLLFAGQLTYAKGPDIAIEAVKQLDFKDISLHILGKGPQKDTLEKMANNDNRIKLHGFVPEAELERQYVRADYTVVPSRWYDNSPMVIYESFQRNTPVIGAEIGGIPELIQEGETGFLFTPDVPEELANLIKDQRGNSDKLVSNVEKVDVSIESHTSDLCSMYQKLLKSYT